MPRITQTAFLKSVWLRYPGTILYHVGILLFVIAALSKYGGFSFMTSAGKQNERRDLDFKKYELDVDPAMPLDKVADEELAEWIDQLLIEKPDDSGRRDGADDERRSKTEEKARDDMNNNIFKLVMESVEVLGEGGSPRDKPRFKMKLGGNSPNIPPGHFPVLKRIIRQRMARPRQQPNLPVNINPAREDLVRNQSDTELQREMHPDIDPLLRQDTNIAVHTLFPALEGTRRVNVLIVAAMRTGSSFLGELFQQRRDFFYMFEPGMQIMHKLDSSNLTRRVIYTKLIDMLHGFYRCKFNDAQFFIDELNHRTLHARQLAISALVSSQFCQETRMVPNHRSKRMVCDPVSEKVLETACVTRDNTAIKSIRVLDINLMISAVRDTNVNLKLIHLVRDPRSMILSRLKLKYPTIKVFNVTELSDTYRNILLKYCSNWLQNYEIGHYVPLMRKNYLMVRYEDLALEPYVYARKIYDFVGLGATIPPTIQTWIDNNTNVNDPSQNKAAAFSTKRDSKEVLVSWKTRLTLEMAQAIEEVGDCTRLMKATGYRLIGDDYMMLNNKDHLVDKVPVPEFDTNAFDFM